MENTINPADQALIDKISFLLTRAGYHMATAESCTGGLIAATCTETPGSSEWFKGGIVAYANEIKRDLLHVSADSLREKGAVSGTVVRQMALGALSVCGAQASIAVSGVAGPSGGTPEKPVGTVWIAIALLEQEGVCILDLDNLSRRLPGCSMANAGEGRAVVHAMRHHFNGDRHEVRRKTTERGLQDLLALLEETIT